MGWGGVSPNDVTCLSYFSARSFEHGPAAERGKEEDSENIGNHTVKRGVGEGGTKQDLYANVTLVVNVVNNT